MTDTQKKHISVSIIDFRMGNLFSVNHALRQVGINPIITTSKDTILSSDALILPGVGAFGEAMTNLEKLDLISVIKDFISTGKPFMGICLGMQLLFEESEEFGNHKGFGLIKGKIKKFPERNNMNAKIKVPQIGWNSIHNPTFSEGNTTRWKSEVLDGINDGEYMYFIHSYYAQSDESPAILSITDYEGVKYCSSIVKGNIFATQFHPEKSGHSGLKIYKNWAHIISKDIINK